MCQSFLFQGFMLKEQREIEILQELCEYVYINVELGLDTPHVYKIPPPRVSVNMRDLVQNAKGLRTASGLKSKGPEMVGIGGGEEPARKAKLKPMKAKRLRQAKPQPKKVKKNGRASRKSRRK